MTDFVSLTGAVEALFPAKVKPFFGQVPDDAVLPWTYVLVSLPAPTERALSRSIKSRRIVVRVRIAATNDAAVRKVARNLIPALEGARPESDDWTCTALEQLSTDPQIYVDRDTTLADGKHPVVAAIDFAFMASPST